MLTSSISSNGPVTAPESTRIKRFITAREKAIKILTEEIEEENNYLTICNNAIANLETAIPEGKTILKAQEENLAAIISIRGRIEMVSTVQFSAMKQEATSEALCDKLGKYRTSPALEALSGVVDQVDLLEGEIRAIGDFVREAMFGLEGWRRQHRFSLKKVEDLNGLMMREEKLAVAARQVLRFIWRVPMEVWAMVFKLAVDHKLKGFLSNDTISPLRSETLNLSQVCRTWRNIIEASPELWIVVSAPPHPLWRPNEHTLLLSSVSKSLDPITLVYNLSQSYNWGYRFDYRWNQ